MNLAFSAGTLKETCYFCWATAAREEITRFPVRGEADREIMGKWRLRSRWSHHSLPGRWRRSGSREFEDGEGEGRREAGLVGGDVTGGVSGVVVALLPDDGGGVEELPD